MRTLTEIKSVYPNKVYLYKEIEERSALILQQVKFTAREQVTLTRPIRSRWSRPCRSRSHLSDPVLAEQAWIGIVVKITCRLWIKPDTSKHPS